MRYTDPSFTVAPSGSYEQAHAMCRQHGHMEPDQRGKCLRCGEKVSDKIAWLTSESQASNAVFTGEQALEIHRQIAQQYAAHNPAEIAFHADVANG